jgi:hypothetical protein
MPREQVNKLQTANSEIDPRVGYNYSPELSITARPIDAYVQPDTPPMADIAKYTAMLSSGVSAYSQLVALNKRTDLKAGSKARLVDNVGEKFTDIYGSKESTAGQTRNEKSRSEKWLEGYDAMDGELATKEYASEVAKYTEANKGLDPLAFTDGLHKLSNAYTAGRTDSFNAAFTQKAIQYETQAQVGYDTYQGQIFHQNAIARTQSIIGHTIDSTLKATLKLGLDADLSDPLTNVTSYLPQKDNIKFTMPALLKGEYNKYYQSMQGMGLNDQEIQAAWVNTVTNYAIKSGTPELLDFFAIPDENGVAMVDNPELGKAVLNARNSAISQQDQNIEEKKKLDDAATLETYNTTINAILTTDVKNRGALVQLQTELSKPENMAKLGTYYDNVMSALQSKIDRKGSLEISNADTIKELNIKRLTGTLTSQDVIKAMGELTDSDISQYSGYVLEEANRKKNEPNYLSESAFKKQYISDFHNVYANRLDTQGVLSKAINRSVADNAFQIQVNKFRKDNKREPNSMDIFAITQDIESKYPPSWQQILLGKEDNTETGKQTAETEKPTEKPEITPVQKKDKKTGKIVTLYQTRDMARFKTKEEALAWAKKIGGK